MKSALKMGAKASDDLYQLIRSMGAAEKRAFKLLSERYSRQGGNHYLLLFDAIAEQEVYDEGALRAQFKGMAFLNNLSEAKSYLYQSVLRSLRFSRGPESAETELREILDHLEILFAKGLNPQAERQVRIGLEKARELDLHAFVAEFYKWQRRLSKWRGGKHLQSELVRLGEEEAEAILNLQLEAKLRDLMGRIQMIFSQQVDGRNAAQQAELEALWEDAALRQPPLKAGFHALVSFHLAHAFYRRSQVQPLPAMQAWESVVATYEAYPVHIKRQADQYINALASLLDARLNSGQIEPIPAELERLRSQKVKEASLVARIFFLEHHISLRYALVTGGLDEALVRVPDLEAGMVKHAKFLGASMELTFLYNLCSLYFLAERYPEAQRFVNQALNRTHLPLREDIIDALRLLEMIARYARGQLDVLEHLHKAYERRLRQQQNKPPFAALVFKFIRKLLDAADAQETQALVGEMERSMIDLAPQIKPAGYEEVLLWVRSRSTRRQMAEIVRAEASASLIQTKQGQ